MRLLPTYSQAPSFLGHQGRAAWDSRAVSAAWRWLLAGFAAALIGCCQEKDRLIGAWTGPHYDLTLDSTGTATFKARATTLLTKDYLPPFNSGREVTWTLTDNKLQLQAASEGEATIQATYGVNLVMKEGRPVLELGSAPGLERVVDYRLLGSFLLAFAAGFVLIGIVLTEGWIRYALGSLFGLVALGFLGLAIEEGTSAAEPWPWTLRLVAPIAAAAAGAIAVHLFRTAEWTKDLIPEARKEISPRLWTPVPDAVVFTSEARVARLGLAYTAMAGTSVGGLITMTCVAEDVIAEILRPFGPFQLAFLLLLSTGFLAPLHEAFSARHASADNQPHDSAHPRRRSWYWYAIIPVWLIGLELLAMGVQQAVKGDFPTAVLVGLTNSLLAGIATYYWAAACQGQMPEMPWRAAKSAATLGAVLFYPSVLLILVIFCLQRAAATVGSGNDMEVKGMGLLLVTSPIGAAILAFLVGCVAYGFHTVAGGWAIERATNWPVWLRILLAVLVAEFVISLLLFAIIRIVSDENDISLADWLGNLVSMLGWGIALAINPRSKELLRAVPRAGTPVAPSGIV